MIRPRMIAIRASFARNGVVPSAGGLRKEAPLCRLSRHLRAVFFEATHASSHDSGLSCRRPAVEPQLRRRLPCKLWLRCSCSWTRRAALSVAIAEYSDPTKPPRPSLLFRCAETSAPAAQCCKQASAGKQLVHRNKDVQTSATAPSSYPLRKQIRAL